MSSSSEDIYPRTSSTVPKSLLEEKSAVRRLDEEDRLSRKSSQKPPHSIDKELKIRSKSTLKLLHNQDPPSNSRLHTVHSSKLVVENEDYSAPSSGLSSGENDRISQSYLVSRWERLVLCPSRLWRGYATEVNFDREKLTFRRAVFVGQLNLNDVLNGKYQGSLSLKGFGKYCEKFYVEVILL